MHIKKRNGTLDLYDAKKIQRAIEKAFVELGEPFQEELLRKIVRRVEENAGVGIDEKFIPNVEYIQDQVEKTLMEMGYFQVAKGYILYRENRSVKRKQRKQLAAMFEDYSHMEDTLREIQNDFPGEPYSLEMLHSKWSTFLKSGMGQRERLSTIIKAAVELTTQEAPLWEMIAARLLYLQFSENLAVEMKELQMNSFYDKVYYLTQEGLYGAYILEHYSREEFEHCQGFLMEERNKLFNYSGLDLLIHRYVVRSHAGRQLETPQEMFLGIAMHLAMKERKEQRLYWVKEFYDMLSTLKVTMATPTLSNARKPYHQLSSCFIDVVPDSLTGIYRSIDNFAQVSKYGGGMGMYFGKVRASGSTIRGFEGAAGGVIRWIKLANDTAVAVDQLGVRQGAVAVYLDIWHKDIPEFLSLRTNNGDDRMKAHDVFPGLCFPDYFWEQVRDNLEGTWHLMCPHEVKTIKGYALEDYFGEEWKQRYLSCVGDIRISKRSILIKDLVRLIIKSAAETGTPFIFNRDIVNRFNPNPHKGMIYCSNLCTEIAQNTSEIQEYQQSVQKIDGKTVVVNATCPGDFVVCNLASLSLGRIELENEVELKRVVTSVVRALDNVIDLNFFPVPYAKITNHKYRPLGLGVSGYHHMLAKRQISWESQKHLELVDGLFEKINYFAIEASCENAKEKGSYDYFQGSDWETGAYFEKRGYQSKQWQVLEKRVAKQGMRNGYLMAVAPTSSTSILSGTTAGIDPIMKQYFLEEKKNGLFPRVAPELSSKTFWYYKNAHLLDQSYSVKACGIRQRHIDQAQSMNLYITTDFTFRKVLDLYLKAFEEGVKTIYYVRSKSLEVEECEFCSS